jgi:hypothetical protein
VRGLRRTLRLLAPILVIGGVLAMPQLAMAVPDAPIAVSDLVVPDQTGSQTAKFSVPTNSIKVMMPAAAGKRVTQMALEGNGAADGPCMPHSERTVWTCATNAQPGGKLTINYSNAAADWAGLHGKRYMVTVTGNEIGVVARKHSASGSVAVQFRSDLGFAAQGGFVLSLEDGLQVGVRNEGPHESPPGAVTIVGLSPADVASKPGHCNWSGSRLVCGLQRISVGAMDGFNVPLQGDLSKLRLLGVITGKHVDPNKSNNTANAGPGPSPSPSSTPSASASPSVSPTPVEPTSAATVDPAPVATESGSIPIFTDQSLAGSLMLYGFGGLLLVGGAALLYALLRRPIEDNGV